MAIVYISIGILAGLVIAYIASRINDKRNIDKLFKEQK